MLHTENGEVESTDHSCRHELIAVTSGDERVELPLRGHQGIVVIAQKIVGKRAISPTVMTASDRSRRRDWSK